MCKSTPNTKYVTQINDCNANTVYPLLAETFEPCYTSGLRQCAFSYAWPLMQLCFSGSSRLLHIAPVFHFQCYVEVTEFCSVTRPQFIHSTINRHHRGFHFLTITSRAAMIILAHVCIFEDLIELQCLVSSSENSNSMVIKMAEVQGIHTSNSKNIFQRHCNNQTSTE